MFKTFIGAVVLVPGMSFADNLTPDQTGVINKTAPFVVENQPTAVNGAVTDVVAQTPDPFDEEPDCDGNGEGENDQDAGDPNPECGGGQEARALGDD